MLGRCNFLKPATLLPDCNQTDDHNYTTIKEENTKPWSNPFDNPFQNTDFIMFPDGSCTLGKSDQLETSIV